MPDNNNLDSLLITYIQQQTASMTTIANNTEAVKNALSKATDSIQENTKVTLEIKAGQIQYQRQAIRICLTIMAIEAMIIAGLLGLLNVKGHQVISDVVEKVVK